MDYIANMNNTREALQEYDWCQEEWRLGATQTATLRAKLKLPELNVPRFRMGHGRKSDLDHISATSSRLAAAMQVNLSRMNTEKPAVIFGRFAFDMVMHALEIDGGGDILRFDLPLDDSSIEQLKTHCMDSLVGLSSAPFGDRHLPKIRSCLELNADCVKGPPEILNFDFADVLDHIREKLSVKAGHVDTVNHEDHFGTLSLPLLCKSSSTGGDMDFYQGRGVEPELCGGRYDLYSSRGGWRTDLCPEIVTCDFNTTEDWSVVGEGQEGLVPFVAWLTDIPHAISPVNKGHRVVLVFKLFRTGGAVDVPVNPTLAKSLWKSLTEIADLPEDAVRGLGVICRHSYPPAALHPRNLKLVDADLHRALKSLGMVPELISVVEMKSGWRYPDYNCKCGSWEHHRQHFIAECKVWMRDRDQRFDYPTVDADMKDDPFGPGSGLWTPECFRSAPGSPRFQSFKQSQCMQRMVYLHLGYGRMVANGEYYYGNHCGMPHWWYRRSIVVIPLDTIRRWEKVRGAVLSAVHRDGLPLLQNLHQECPHIFKQLCEKLLQDSDSEEDF
ncbi:hypothetical protein BSKO_02697 [Bryopsis sp. KO-2023]|nr:hypothetical protein BSKO_02697 [Bryopsis sp. KO-2023]